MDAPMYLLSFDFNGAGVFSRRARRWLKYNTAAHLDVNTARRVLSGGIEVDINLNWDNNIYFHAARAKVVGDTSRCADIAVRWKSSPFLPPFARSRCNYLFFLYRDNKYSRDRELPRWYSAWRKLYRGEISVAARLMGGYICAPYDERRILYDVN